MVAKGFKNFKLSSLTIWILASFVVVIILLILYTIGVFHKKWSSFTTYGGVGGNIINVGSKIIYGTNYSRLNIQDIHDSSNLRSFDLNNGTPNPQKVEGCFVYVISADTLWKINYCKSEIVWKFAAENSYTIERTVYEGSRIFISSSDGSLRVINKLTGKLSWLKSGTLPTNSASRTVGKNVYYGPDFWVQKNNVYMADRTGNFYALDIGSGKVAWTYDIKSTIIGNFTLYKNRIYLFSLDKKIFAIDSRTGKTLFVKDTDQKIVCADIYKGKLIEQGDMGQLYSRNLVDGEIIWKSESFGSSLICPQNYYNDGVFSKSEGVVIKINLNTGKTMWTSRGFGETNLSLVKVNGGLLGKSYIYSGQDGKVWSISSKGTINWMFNAHSPIDSSPIVIGSNLIIGTSGAEIYKINKFFGRTVYFATPFQFKTDVDKVRVAQDDIVEISLKSNSLFVNPWNEGYLSAFFTGPAGESVFVDGFYYDDNVWKIRFNPIKKGLWTYSLTWDDHGTIYHKQGKFISDTDANSSYLKVSKDNPKRLTLDDKNIFNLVGLQQSVLDYNNSGSPLDDWATGVGAPSVSSASPYIDLTVSSIINWVDLEDFIDIYGPKGAGFNLFRYGVNNVSIPPYSELLHPTIYSISNSKILDELFVNLRSNDIHVWFSLFSFGMPYGLDLTPSNKYLFTSYVRNIIARYGAYVDIWELFNEYEAPEYIKSFLISEIKKYDYLNRPITTSPEDYTTPGIDIISPHWYETESLSKSSMETYNYINKFTKYNEPVVFGEQGNAIFNWTPDSATRMRVRLWTAFMNNGAMVFWSSSSVRGLIQNIPFFANIFLGDEERLYVKNLQQFTYPVTLNSNPTEINVGDKAILGYGLVSEDQFLGYFVNTDKYNKTTTFSTKLFLPVKGSVDWYDPKTGRFIRKDVCSKSECYVTSPTFNVDIALKLIK